MFNSFADSVASSNFLRSVALLPADKDLSATRAASTPFPVANPFLTDEPVAVHEDPADRRRRRAERERTYEFFRGVGEQVAIRYSKEDWARRAHEASTRGADATIRAALPGENQLDPEAFKAIVELAFPRADYPRERRQAERSGRVEWGGGVVFVRVGDGA